MSCYDGKDGLERAHEVRDDSALFFTALAGRLKALKDDPVIGAVFRAAGGRGGLDIYLVGGVLRNILLDHASPADYDFVFEGDVEGLSERVAAALGGSAFILDLETSHYRVAVKSGGGTRTIDLSLIKDGGIVSDLKGRDFTVDAVGLGLGDLFEEDSPVLIDPAEGVNDARLGILKMTSLAVFGEDPLRTLRAVRLSQWYGLKITQETAAGIRAGAPLLKSKDTSWERIRDEFLLIFSAPGTAQAVRALYDLKIMETVFPEFLGWEDIGAGYDLLTHSLKTLDEAEAFLEALPAEPFPDIPGLELHFNASIGPVGRRALFKMAAFVHDIGKHLTVAVRDGQLRFIAHEFEGSELVKEVFTRLRFSRRVVNELSVLVKNHHRFFAFANLDAPSHRAKAHFFRAVGGEAALDLLCLALIDVRATIGAEDEELLGLVKDMLRLYYDEFALKRPAQLLNGTEIVKTFKVPEGRLVGEVIEKISEGVETGVVRNKKEAIRFVRQWLSTKEGVHR
jgi:tRNA nucleotidyltransferase/poly(A) polymerase